MIRTTNQITIVVFFCTVDWTTMSIWNSPTRSEWPFSWGKKCHDLCTFNVSWCFNRLHPAKDMQGQSNISSAATVLQAKVSMKSNNHGLWGMRNISGSGWNTHGAENEAEKRYFCGYFWVPLLQLFFPATESYNFSMVSLMSSMQYLSLNAQLCCALPYPPSQPFQPTWLNSHTATKQTSSMILKLGKFRRVSNPPPGRHLKDFSPKPVPLTFQALPSAAALVIGIGGRQLQLHDQTI